MRRACYWRIAITDAVNFIHDVYLQDWDAVACVWHGVETGRKARSGEARRAPAQRGKQDMTQTGEVAISPAVQASNALTARWAECLGEHDFVCSGAGLWPLLGLLATAADEAAAAELSAALGRPADTAGRDALELIDLLATGISTTAALGLWKRKLIELHDEWASQLPDGIVGTLTDQAALDRWAAEKTGGLIDQFPLQIQAGTALVLASALAAKVKWREPFDVEPRHARSRKPAPADRQSLSRSSFDLSIVSVLDDTVTRVVVEGAGDVDVHLLIGGRMPPADVLAAGLRELAGQAQIQPAADLRAGAGFAVQRIVSDTPQDIVQLSLPSFEIKVRHDLMENADLFGFRSLTDPVVSHLPKLSPDPLYIAEGAQSVLARFFAEGFEAAAVTAFGLRVTGVPSSEHQVNLLELRLNRPFGFIAVHRRSRLAVVAGWVSSVFDTTAEDEDDWDEVDLEVVGEAADESPFSDNVAPQQLRHNSGIDDYGYSDYR